MNMGSKVFKSFHEDVYSGLNRFLAYKKVDIKNKEYLETLLKKDNNRFEPIADAIQNVAKGDGGNYLDRIAVQIATKDLLENKKEYNLDIETFQEIDNWYNRLVSSPSKFKS